MYTLVFPDKISRSRRQKENQQEIEYVIAIDPTEFDEREGTQESEEENQLVSDNFCSSPSPLNHDVDSDNRRSPCPASDTEIESDSDTESEASTGMDSEETDDIMDQEGNEADNPLPSEMLESPIGSHAPNTIADDHENEHQQTCETLDPALADQHASQIQESSFLGKVFQQSKSFFQKAWGFFGGRK